MYEVNLNSVSKSTGKFLQRCLFLLLITLFVFSFSSYSQINFRGLLINKNDSTKMAFASVKLIELQKYTSSNENGNFNFVLPEKLSVLHFEISSIGCHTTISYYPKYSEIESIYVNQLPTIINEVMIEGLSAKSVVEKAITSIPLNYIDTSYASYAFYRQYQKVNNTFKNLIEAQHVVMFNLSRSHNQITSKEAFAVTEMRKSFFKHDVKDYYGDCFNDLFNQNPIYHLENSSLNTKSFMEYSFSFDTIMLFDTYVINYVCNYSSDNHGIDNFSQVDFKGESIEYGKIFIDKESFAIKRYERTSIRNKKYNYPKFNNFIRPSLNYTVEFLEGHLIMEYESINKKWYLKKILRDYTNEFYRTQTYNKEFTVTDVFEWYSDTPTRYIPEQLLDKFYFTPQLSNIKYYYNSSKWLKPLPGFYLYNKEKVYKDLEKKFNLEFQFEKSGN